MNSSRNKKLLACFLTALGLTTNSANVNVSASFKQFGGDLRFALNLGGEKAEERKKLDQLADKIGKFLKGNTEVKLSDIASELYKNLFEIACRRCKENYNSKLYDDLTGNNANQSFNAIKDYPGNINGNKTKDWIGEVYKSVHGGKLTVFQGKIKIALSNLVTAMTASDNKDEDKDLIKAWSATAYQQDPNTELEEIADGVECYLYKDGNLQIKTNKSNVIGQIFDKSIIADGTENSVKKVTIPDSVQEIESDIFNNCQNLEEITIPNSVATIGSDIFSNCEKLKTVKISKDSPIKGKIKEMLPKECKIFINDENNSEDNK